jgi:hypothetical protein
LNGVNIPKQFCQCVEDTSCFVDTHGLSLLVSINTLFSLIRAPKALTLLTIWEKLVSCQCCQCSGYAFQENIYSFSSPKIRFNSDSEMRQK